jgi:arginyl-tRNA synthetase
MDGSPNLNLGQKNYNYFPLQYTHARCCSLLRLAAAEGLVHLQGQGKIAKTPKISWLDRHNAWQLVTPSAQRLINQLVNLADEFDINKFEESSSPTQRRKWQKLATKISLSFEEFYRYNRIFGAECRANLPLAQARLGLVALTQGGLQKLLEEYLGAIAPSEL